MTQEKLEKALSIEHEIRSIEGNLGCLNSKDGLYSIELKANNRKGESRIMHDTMLKDIAMFLHGYLESRKSELEKEFDSL